VPLASGTLRVASGSHLTREDHQTGRTRLAGWAVPQPFRFRTTRVPIVCRLSDSRQRLSLGNCQRMPFSFAGLAVSPPTEYRNRYRAGRVGIPASRGELSG